MAGTGVSFASLLYRPIYDRLAVSVQLTLGGVTYPTADQVNAGLGLVALDKTQGIELAQGPTLTLETVKPRCEFIVGDLTALGISPDSLDDGTVTLNGNLWTITSHRFSPTTSGTNDGTVWCELESSSDA
jgi:hypothetical protein